MKTKLFDSKRHGAFVLDDGSVRFSVWAPLATHVELIILDDNREERWRLPMVPLERGYHEITTRKSSQNSLYLLSLDGRAGLPDPASRFQPFGVHGPSKVIESHFDWSDLHWKGNELKELSIYELHVGAFSSQGTFIGVTEKIQHFKMLGINAIELMPVAQFPGSRNWGYDGVGLFAVQNSYGGPRELKKLINECHRQGLNVILDVVYNHLGPEGNYLSQFGPYFQSKYKTPWGEALNFDGEWSDEVRRFFFENVRQWFEEYHFDGLRLDAVHAIFDSSAVPFLENLSQLKAQLEKKLARRIHLIAESDANDSRLLQSVDQGGFGLDSQWADDFHHEIHALLTGESQGYYKDYGLLSQLKNIYEKGVIYDDLYSDYRHRSHGRSYSKVENERLVIYSQNHDQIGNRLMGERLISLAGEEKQRLAAACVFLSPFLPLIFMGEEFGETSPFLYFVDHGDPQLLVAVRKGRNEEFSSFAWQGEPPDPASEETFLKSRINWNWQPSDSRVREWMQYYQRLIEISKWIRKGGILERGRVKSEILKDRVLKIEGRKSGEGILIFFSFHDRVQEVLTGFSGELDVLILSEANPAFTRKISSGLGSFTLNPYEAAAFRFSDGSSD